MNWYTTIGLAMAFAPLTCLLLWALWVSRPKRSQWKDYAKGGALVGSAVIWVLIINWLLKMGSQP